MNPGRSEVLGQHAGNPAQPSVVGETLSAMWCTRCQAVAFDAPAKDSVHCCPVCKTPSVLRTWKVSALEDRITAQFEQEVRRRARLAYQLMDRDDPEEADKMRSLYQQEFSAGQYNWEDGGVNSTNHVRNARGKTWGALYLIYLLMVRCDPTVTEKVATDVAASSPKDWLEVYHWALGLPKNLNAPVEPSPTGASETTVTSTTQQSATTNQPPVAATFGGATS